MNIVPCLIHASTCMRSVNTCDLNYVAVGDC